MKNRLHSIVFRSFASSYIQFLFGDSFYALKSINRIIKPHTSKLPFVVKSGWGKLTHDNPYINGILTLTLWYLYTSESPVAINTIVWHNLLMKIKYYIINLKFYYFLPTMYVYQTSRTQIKADKLEIFIV